MSPTVSTVTIAEAEKTSPSGVLDRTLAILELLAHNATGLPLSTIAERLGIPRSATHRLLSDLAGRGYVRQDREGGDYRLTTKLVSLSFAYFAGLGITDIAQPVLDRLAAATGELVRLAVVDDRRLTWVAKAQGALSGLRYDPETGTDAQLSCSSAGYAWLATMSDAEALARVQVQGFGRPDEFGPRAPCTKEALLRQLRLARRRGYGVAIETYSPWMAAAAAVVREGRDGPVRGTVSIAGPMVRVTEAKLHDLAPLLLGAAEELSAACAGSPSFHRGRAAG